MIYAYGLSMGVIFFFFFFFGGGGGKWGIFIFSLVYM